MFIVEKKQLANTSHRNINGADHCPNGWAIVPATLVIPDSFPFVDIVVSEKNYVIAMFPREVPEPEPVKPVPTVEDRLAEAEEEIESLKAENEMISEVLDTLLME